MRPDSDIAGCVAAHERVLETIAPLTDDDDVRRPSLLPDWTIAHVLAHLARNADSHVHMLDGAARGEVLWQYPSAEHREQAIEEGARRPAVVLLDDVRASFAGLHAAWDATSDDVWANGRSRSLAGEFAIAQQPFRRWREVEVHHADLGLGFSPGDWSDAYVALELAAALAEVDERLPPGTTVPAADDRRVLAWLLGRSHEPDWPVLAPWQRDQRGPRP